MLHALMAPVIAWMTGLMAAMGPYGVMLLMGIESACIPLPSEVIMPFAGFLAFQGRLDLHGLGGGNPVAQIWIAGLFGALGCNLGSIPAYELGRWGGHPAVKRFGRYIWLHEGHLDAAHRFFTRFGPEAILIGRLLPVVRTFIALPAGVAEMDRAKFHLYTFLGSLPWCLGLAYLGYKLGQKWDTLGVWFHRFDTVIVAAILAGLVWFVWDHFKHRTR
ncbi:MAG TPA: DedA family protein [Holophagaceae bacterium]|jgi:membrane protein DedA with SNARE-associated domain|nr:DedA family protein [Holophagaceae bacterium]